MAPVIANAVLYWTDSIMLERDPIKTLIVKSSSIIQV